MLVDEGGVLRGVDRAAVAEEDQVLADGLRGVDDALGDLGGFREGHRGVGHADRAADRGAHVGDDDVRAGLGHGLGLFGRADVDDGEHLHLAGEGDGLEFLLHAHAGLFEDLAELAVDDRVGREVVDAREAHVLHLAQPVPHAAARVGGVDAADDGDFFDDGQHLVFADLHRDGVGVAVGHHAGRGAVASHAEAAGVVDDDQVGAAAFDELGADARAGAGGDDRLALGHRVTETGDDFGAGVGVSFSGPGVGHGDERGWVVGGCSLRG